MSFYTHSLISRGISFEKYLAQFEVAIESSDIEDPKSRKMAEYIQKNSQIMDELEDKILLSDELKKAINKSKQAMWLVLTEPWCGDAAQAIPVFHAISEYSEGKIDLRFFLRDQNLGLMDQHLTDGGRSIPKVIILDQGLNEVGTWGPRPVSLQNLVKEWKSQNLALEELVSKLMEWYGKDKTKSTQKELAELIKSYS